MTKKELTEIKELIEECAVVEVQRFLTNKVQEVIKEEIVKVLNTDFILRINVTLGARVTKENK
jgi:hypothetical protein